MSSDNQIVILESLVSKGSDQKEYRVSHIQGWKNIYDQPDQGDFNTEALYWYFQNSPIFYDKKDAYKFAANLKEEFEWTEHVTFLTYFDFPFPQTTEMFVGTHFNATAVYGFLKNDFSWIPLVLRKEGDLWVIQALSGNYVTSLEWAREEISKFMEKSKQKVVVVVEGGNLQEIFGDNIKAILVDYDNIERGDKPGEFSVEPLSSLDDCLASLVKENW